MQQHLKKAAQVERHSKRLLLVTVRLQGVQLHSHQQQKAPQEPRRLVPVGILLLWEGWLAG
jgi:hypothetical protein